MQAKVFVNHIGFLCLAKKQIIVEGAATKQFHIQDMGQIATQNLGEFEDWLHVFTGELEPFQSPMGEFLVGDFSEITRPGVYRAVLADGTAHSFHFVISDGVFHHLPRLLLDFIHTRRAGDFENALRGPSHLDDAIHSETGEQIDLTGGWYDAGDLRKWTATTYLPVLSFLDMAERRDFHWNQFAAEEIEDNDWLTELIWGVRGLLKMYDKNSGLFLEDIGGGGESRKEKGMHWWYENHAGVFADNSQNHFTDNKPNSGDERPARASYNPIVQYVSSTILLETADSIRDLQPVIALQCEQAAWKCWTTMQEKLNDDYHGWTSVRAWRLQTAIALVHAGLLQIDDAEDVCVDVMELFDEQNGWWWMDTSKKDFYRGILHSAQPIRALAEFILSFPDADLAEDAAEQLSDCWKKYIEPMLQTNPFGIMPYGTWKQPATEEDHYHNFDENRVFRFTMPDNASAKVNHGLASHWLAWADALAIIGRLFDIPEATHAAWQQIFWQLGCNPLNCSLMSGVGYNNPMPHSRFFGTIPGGLMAGPRGDSEDNIFIDLEGRADWASTEYWNVPVAYLLSAFAQLLPENIKTQHKLGA